MPNDIVQKVINANDIENGRMISYVNEAGQFASASGSHVNSFTATANLNSTYKYSFNPDEVFTQHIHSSGNTPATGEALIPAISNRSIQVVSYALVTSVATEIKFLDNGTPLISGMSFAANGGVSHTNNHGLFSSSTGQGINISSTVAGNVGGHISYKVK